MYEFHIRKSLMKSSHLEDRKEKYEFSNILDRMFISYFNLVHDLRIGGTTTTEGKIDEKDVMQTALRSVSKKMLSEIKEKKLPVKEDVINDALGFSPPSRSHHTRSRSFSLPKLGKIEKTDFVELSKILSKISDVTLKGDNEKEAKINNSVYQYLTIGVRSQQWAVPDAFFEYIYDKYSVRNEAFSSPFNSFMIKKILAGKDGRYFSLFDDDKYFGSCGNFFDTQCSSSQTLTSSSSSSSDSTSASSSSSSLDTKTPGEKYSGNWIVDPPYTPSVLEKTVQFIKGTTRKMILVTPTWSDASWYKELEQFATSKEVIRGMRYQIYTGPSKGFIYPNFSTTIWSINMTTEKFADIIKSSR
jgi:hypothetical protein